MSEQKTFIIQKTTPNDLLFSIHPVSNPGLTKLIHLTKRSPKTALPQDWALGVFFDDALYHMYQQGMFTFNDNEGLAKAGMEAGVYFNDTLDFTPATENKENEIVEILKKGVRAEILDTIPKYGKEMVTSVAAIHADELTSGVLRILEEALGVQLILNQD